MSITLLQNTLRIKNKETGEMQPIAMFGSGADKTLQEINTYVHQKQEDVITQVESAIQDIENKKTDSVSAVESKASECVNAIEQKGVETLESIPKDYTTLSSDVGSLKDDLENLGNLTIIKTSNLFDATVKFEGTVSNTKGEFISSDTGYWRTDYFEVEGNIEYACYFRLNPVYQVGLRGAWYDHLKNYISGFMLNVNNAKVTSPQNAKYCVFCWDKTKTSNDYGIYFGKSSEPFSVKDTYVKEQSLPDYLVTKNSYNKYNYKTVHAGKLINSNVDTHGLIFDDILNLPNSINAGYYVSDLIPIFANKYTSFFRSDVNNPFNMLRVYEFDRNKRFIGYYTDISEYVPSKYAKYFAFGSPNGYKPESWLIIEGTSANENGVYKEKIVLFNGEPLVDESIFDWKNKKICTYGDSITEYGFWQKFVVEYHKFGAHYLRGISGSKVCSLDPKEVRVNESGEIVSDGGIQILDYFCNQDRVNTIPTDSDLVLIMGGTNDFYSNIPLGNIEYNNGYNEASFKGALASTIKKIIDRTSNNAVICLMTLLNGQGTAYTNNAEVRVNSLGLKAVDYANATKEVAEYFGIPCIDVFGEAGINSWNRTQYIRDDITHPTYNILNSGADQIARVVAGKLKTILPKFDKVVY